MTFKKIFVFFLFWRFFDFLILFLAPFFIPHLGFFPYLQELKKFNLPQWIFSLANFDGVHYLKIASHGYEQYEQAFFPLYPLLIRLTTPIFFNNSLLAGLFISNLSFLFGLYFFSKYLKILKIQKSFIFYILYFIFLFPTSFFFGAVYTEGLFFFLSAACLYFLQKKKYFLVSIFAFLASLTKLIGIFLIIPLIIHIFSKTQKSKLKTKKNYSLNFLISQLLNFFIISLLSPLFGLATYSFYLWKTSGDPFFFLTSQPIFGANRSTEIILLPQVYFRYLKIFLTASFNFQYFISIFEFIVFNFIFFILILDLLRNLKLKIFPNIQYQISNIDQLGLNIFSLANLLLPTLTGTFSSIPRYALFSLSFFLFLGKIKNHWTKLFILFIFLIWHIIILGFFAQGYFVS